MNITENKKARAVSISADEQCAPVVCLKDVPMEERRKEADKPLFLIRYE